MSTTHHDHSAPVDSERTEIRDAQIFAVPSREQVQSGIATLPAPTVHELVGQSLDHYLIESLVGIGGMGAVFRGRDQRLDRVVAIKVVPIAHREAESLRRFRVEAQSAAKLDHPNIARVFYVGETERWSYIVFEFIEGTNLRQLVLERGPLSVDDATRFTCQVAEALQHAYERGVVHRDIKPSNILIGLDGRAKIVDMGLARTTQLDRSSGDLTASGVTLGTFDYISPEQAHDPRDADVRSDIYSLGCTLYFLLTAQPPFPDGTALQKLLLHGTKMPEDPRCFRNDISDALIAILRKMMAKKPKDRYQEPLDLVNDLRTLAAMDSLDWRHEWSDEASNSIPAGRSWWEFFLPAVVCLAGIGLITLWLYNDNQRSGVYVIPRVELREIAAPTIAASEISASEISASEISASEISASEIAASEIAASKITASKITASEIAASEIAASEIAPSKIAPSEIAHASVAPRENVPPPPLSQTDPSIDPASRQPYPPSAIVLIDGNTPVSGSQKLSETARSIEEAIARWVANPSIDRIVLAVPSIKIAKPISIPRMVGRTLRLEGSNTFRPTLVLGDAGGRLASEPVASWLMIDGAVELRGLDVDVTYNALDGAPPSVFQIATGSRLRISDSTITIKSPTSGRLPGLFCFKSPASQPAASSSIHLERCAIRGQGDVIRVESSDRIEMEFNEIWAAVTGCMIDIEGAKTLNRSPRIRAELNHVTSITLNPWLRVRMGTSNPYPVPFVRIANESIFSGSQTLVEWDASNAVDWPFSEQANRADDLGRWIDLRGMDNVYDVPTIMRLLQVIMSMSSEEVSIDSDSHLLRNELGMELLAAWQNAPPWEAARMHVAVPRSTDGGASIRNPGCHAQQIPPFPARTSPNAP